MVSKIQGYPLQATTEQLPQSVFRKPIHQKKYTIRTTSLCGIQSVNALQLA
jgi:hypothetical protein